MARETFGGLKKGRIFTARVVTSREASGRCGTCNGPTRRSRYGILHRDCFVCRYLKLIYGPGISVTREED